VSFAPPALLEAAWPAFLEGAGVDDDPPRIRALQVLRMLELLAGPTLDPGVRRVVADRLQATLG
jgi:hypothetical protein